jgi:hypothetical protein
MKYIYVVLLIFVLFVLIYLITEDRCAIEKFTQLNDSDGKIICDDEKANNTFSGDQDGKIIDNSYCTFNYESVCNRPFANNYDDFTSGTPSSDISVCGDLLFKDNGNYLDVYDYETDETGEFILDDNSAKIKKKLLPSEINGNPLRYLGREVTNNDGVLIYSDAGVGEDANVYKQTNLIDNSKCKTINNKLCRFPMAKTKVNSLYGISSEDEFKSTHLPLVSNTGELLPGNMLTQSPLFDDKINQIRQNKKVIFKELFYDSDTIEGNGLNLWDDNGFVDMTQLTSTSGVISSKQYDINNNSGSVEVINSYVDNFNNVINRKGYELKIPRNYYELVQIANEADYHVALAVNDNADKYACGIGTTKAMACDIALARCKTFIPLEKFSDYFKDQKGSLVAELIRRRSVYPIKYRLNNSIYDAEINISDSDKSYLNIYYDNDEKENHKINLENFLNSNDTISLAVMYYRMLSHKELYSYFKNHSLSEEEKNSVNQSSTAIASLNTILKYIMEKSIEEDVVNKCGILMIDNERYMNYNNDATNVITHCTLPDTMTKRCDDSMTRCQEAVVVGLNNSNECEVFKGVKQTFPEWDKYDKIPDQDMGAEKWINEKNEIHANNKIDLIDNILDECKMSSTECILYKINGETYSYNTLFS